MPHATPAQLIEQTLETVAERIGDPAPRVYQRLFARAPDLEPLFVNDRSGAVRAEMFMKAIDVIRDLVDQNHFARGLVASEWINHRNLGVPMERFGQFFEALGQVMRDALGTDWTPNHEAAWGGVLAQLQGIIDEAAAQG